MSKKNLLMHGALNKVLKNYVGSKLITNANKYVQGTNKKRRRGGQIHINTLGEALSRHLPGGALRSNNNFERMYTTFMHGKRKNMIPNPNGGRLIQYAHNRNANNYSPNIHKTARSIYTARNSLHPLARTRSARIIKNRFRNHRTRELTKELAKNLGTTLGRVPIQHGARGSYATFPQNVLNRIARMRVGMK